MGLRCTASAENGYAHSRECIDEAGEAQGWKPTAEDYATCGPSAPTPPTQAQAGAVPLTDEQLAEMMRETWGCASIAPRHAIGFARAIERAHGIGIKGGHQ